MSSTISERTLAELARLHSPYAAEEDPGAFRTTGWHRAYEARPNSFAVAAESAADIAAAMNAGQHPDLFWVLRGGGGTFGYLEPQWQHSLWGANYPSLLEIKQTYDPASVFRVHHGTDSEAPGPPDAVGSWR